VRQIVTQIKKEMMMLMMKSKYCKRNPKMLIIPIHSSYLKIIRCRKKLQILNLILSQNQMSSRNQKKTKNLQRNLKNKLKSQRLSQNLLRIPKKLNNNLRMKLKIQMMSHLMVTMKLRIKSLQNLQIKTLR
jgi:hypothetical protein